jgi:hypothetical protein
VQKVVSITKGMVSSLTAARLSFASGVATIVFLGALHFLSPEFDPSWRMVSEYAFGDYGWVLSLMFLSWALSCITLFLAIRSQVHTVGGKIGLGSLLVSAAGMSMAAFFDINHSLHGLATIIGNIPFLIAAVLISLSLVRNPVWAVTRRSLLWMAILPWVSVALVVIVMFVGLSQNGNEFGPGVPIGWPNRIAVLTYCGWLITAARGAIRWNYSDSEQLRNLVENL